MGIDQHHHVNGVNQDQFVQSTNTLPPDALHDEFRVRFQPDVSASNDEWYIDDIAVDLGDCTFPALYGNATPGGGGIVPIIDFNGLASIGSSNFEVTGDDMFGGQTGFFFTGFTGATGQLGNGIWLNVLPPWIITPITTSGLPLPGQGSVTVPIAIPNDPTLVDVHLYFFFLTVDPISPTGYAGTQGLDVTICE